MRPGCSSMCPRLQPYAPQAAPLLYLHVCQAVKKAFQRKQMAGYLRILGGGLTVHPAPEPHDVIWENLQCPPREVLLRQVGSGLEGGTKAGPRGGAEVWSQGVVLRCGATGWC